ncbi:hypothetical protein UPYG_G00237230 [Umbra pygmaea]|uniref:Ig-like domain-containing protein n=1 Tax=Umbra pygmaea TaxID=75934 RepID=A0ABD0X539_UMBPY
MNTKNYSLTIRDLTLTDSGDFKVTGKWEKGQIPSKTITLNVQETVSKVVIQKKVQLSANQSCSVQLMCNASGYSDLTYTWTMENNTYRDNQLLRFFLSPAEGPISVTCNASNIFSFNFTSIKVECTNDSTGVIFDHLPGMQWYIFYIVIPVVITAVVVMLIVTVVLCKSKGHNKATDDQMDHTIYTDVGEPSRVKDTRSNSQINPMSIYETVDECTFSKPNPPQTLYDKITFGRTETQTTYQEVL